MLKKSRYLRTHKISEMRFLLIVISALLIVSCSSKESNISISGHVDGLKKGKLYLQEIVDTTLVSIDSIVIDGDAEFEFEAFIDSPQVLYLYLDKLDNSVYDDRFRFFAEPGEMTVTTSLKSFEDATVTGSVNHDVLMEYNAMLSRFNRQNLDLIKAEFEAQKEDDTAKIKSVQQEFDNQLKRRYLYTVNYALNHKDKAIAPYLATSEIFDANVKYLDTIYNSLSRAAKTSRYGKELKALLKERSEE